MITSPAVDCSLGQHVHPFLPGHLRVPAVARSAFVDRFSANFTFALFRFSSSCPIPLSSPLLASWLPTPASSTWAQTRQGLGFWWESESQAPGSSPEGQVGKSGCVRCSITSRACFLALYTEVWIGQPLPGVRSWSRPGESWCLSLLSGPS